MSNWTGVGKAAKRGRYFSRILKGEGEFTQSMGCGGEDWVSMQVEKGMGV